MPAFLARILQCNRRTPFAQIGPGSQYRAGRIQIPPPSLKWPLSLRGTSGERGLVPSNCRALLKSPLPDPPHFFVVGRGNRPRAWWWYQDAPCRAENPSRETASSSWLHHITETGRRKLPRVVHSPRFVSLLCCSVLASLKRPMVRKPASAHVTISTRRPASGRG